MIKNLVKASIVGAVPEIVQASGRFAVDLELKPRAITMWDFSWLERRWPGAGYEDWDKVLDELVDRGYNAVRIDAYPHFVAEDPEREYTLLPVWNTQSWGSPDINKVRVQPFLNQFIAKCRDRDIRVGLSSWYREDTDQVRMKIDTPQRMAENWIKTLESIGREGLLDAILYVDLCNEWPGDMWCPYFKNDPPQLTWTYWHTVKSMQYMHESLETVRKSFPALPLCYSFTGGDPKLYVEKDLSMFDLIEHHIWMAQLNGDEYYKQVGYNYERFSPEGYQNLVANHERVYYERREYWQQLFIHEIGVLANAARTAHQPLITTECWALVDFKDWPLLQWNVVKELCELGVRTASATGQWVAMATSNFCGPQFAGMWRDVEWHRNLTTIIKTSKINPELIHLKVAERL
jgi:hypothetical protein